MGDSILHGQAKEKPKKKRGATLKKKRRKKRAQSEKPNRFYLTNISKGSKLYRFMKQQFLRDEDGENMREMARQMRRARKEEKKGARFKIVKKSSISRSLRHP